jgi:YVTN family beta-propeller protein
MLLLYCGLWAADFHPPADRRYAQVSGSNTILPGGKLLQPFGTQIQTGPGTCAIALSPKGSIATANAGPERFSVTVLEPVKTSWAIGHFWARTPNYSLPEKADPNWKGVACGIAFENDRAVWVSEGDSGKVRLLNSKSGNHEKIVDLNSPESKSQPQSKNSFTADLAYDPAHHLLYVIDQGKQRLAVVDAKKGQVLGSAKVGSRSALHLAVSPDGAAVFISAPNGRTGVMEVRVPGESSEVTWIEPGSEGNVSDGGGILAIGDHVYVSDAANDSLIVFSTADRKKVAEIPLRIPGLENLRGIRPAGLAYDPLTKWVLVAESGINAVGVIDTTANRFIGHIPAGLQPLGVAVAGDRVFVTNSKGRGAGPNLRHPLIEFGETPALHHGSISTFIMPAEGALENTTRLSLVANGFIANGFVGNDRVSGAAQPAQPPQAIRSVVLIVKGNRSFDEIFGDTRDFSDTVSGRVQAVPQLARYGLHGRADGGKQQFSIKDVAVTPNEHALAERYTFSDNYYADSPLGDASELAAHMERLGTSYRVFDEAEANISDQVRADRVIAELNKIGPGQSLPAFILIRLPNDKLEAVAASDAAGHAYPASWVSENDFATGRIVDYLSHKEWWRDMAIFVAESASDSGLDHVDAQRVPLVAVGPWIKRRYVSHTNSDCAGLVKTILSLLHLPPIGLADAAARDLQDIYSAQPDYSPVSALPPDKRIFDPQSHSADQ